MTVVDEHGRPEPPTAGNEAATLLGFLDFQRATLEWKCRGVDADGLRATVAASPISLGGLLKHMARVEEGWFTWRLHGRRPLPPWDTVEWAWEWQAAADFSPDELFDEWRAAVDRSRHHVAEALADGGLERPAAIPWDDGRSPSLRWIVVHMIEEYARHNGHADLLRESVDGETGE
jgi:uncharacterized damage-inducible protein DinB